MNELCISYSADSCTVNRNLTYISIIPYKQIPVDPKGPLTVVYNVRNWVFGHYSSSCILRNTKVHNVSKTGTVSGTLCSLVSQCLLTRGRKQIHFPKLCVFKCFSDYRTMGKDQKAEIPNAYSSIMSRQIKSYMTMLDPITVG